MKLLVVDDDYNTLMRITDAISAEKNGVDEIITAISGQNAYDIILEEMPEIILSDIEMPGMDGLELLKKVSETYEQMPEFIFLTAHDNFQYARQALRYGVLDYLTKPFEQDELIAVIAKAVMEARKKLVEETGEQSDSEPDNRSYILQNFFRNLFDNVISGNTEKLEIFIKNHGIPVDVRTAFYCIRMDVSLTNSDQIEDRDEIFFALRSITAEIIYEQLNYNYIFPSMTEGRVNMLLLIKEEDYCKGDIKEKCHRLNEVIKRYLNLNVSCIISNPVLPEDFRKTAEALRDLSRKFGTFASRAVMSDELNAEDGTINAMPLIETGKLQEFLNERNKTGFILSIRNEMQRVSREGTMTSGFMQALHHEILQVFYVFLAEYHIQATVLFNNDTYQALYRDAQSSPINMIRYVDYVFDLAVKQVAESAESQTVIDKVKHYIEDHYMEDLSRDDIASFACLSPNYLSKLWSRRTGTSLREYINECRINEAKRRLISTDETSTEISLAVGFGNITYFSSTFKKYTGMTPSEWKTRNST